MMSPILSEEERDAPGEQCTDAGTHIPRSPAAPSVQAQAATCYTVRNDWAWAHIFVRHGTGVQTDGSPRGWVHVSVISDFGSFGYCWTHIGPDRWREFLAGLDLHYAMQKMLGERFRVPLAIHEAEAKGRQMILQYRREDSLDAEDARKLWDGLDAADRDGGLDGFLRDWDRQSDGRWYAHDWWDASWDKVNPQAEGFWREIWPHFIAGIQSEAARATGPASPQGAEGEARSTGSASIPNQSQEGL